MAVGSPYFFSLIEVWVQKTLRLNRLKLYLNLLIEVKTSACAVWQQQSRSRAQRTEDRKVLIVSLSVPCKIGKTTSSRRNGFKLQKLKLTSV